MMRVLLVGMMLGFVGPASAEVISFQDPATGDQGYGAQDFEEEYDFYDGYQLDDLDLGLPGWRLESAVTYWRYGVVEAEFYRTRIYSDLPTGADIDQYLLKEYCGISGEYGPSGFWEVAFDLQGDVYNGTIWIAGYVRADFDEVGQDFWRNANAENLGYEPNGSEEYVWRWGTGWEAPRPGSEVYGETADMSWKIEGTPVPEPGMIPLLVAAAFSVAQLRRKRT